MNAVEHIVESYFRLCRDCLTYSDVKVISGNNRQIDLLAISLKTKEQFHVECSVTHCLGWNPTPSKLIAEFKRKFSGHPKERQGRNTDFPKGKAYAGSIFSTYRQLGMDFSAIKRIWICWSVNKPETLEQELDAYYMRTGQRVEVLEFRDKILPELMKAVKTANYDDEVLRVFSLIKQAEVQTKRRM